MKKDWSKQGTQQNKQQKYQSIYIRNLTRIFWDHNSTMQFERMFNVAMAAKNVKIPDQFSVVWQMLTSSFLIYHRNYLAISLKQMLLLSKQKKLNFGQLHFSGKNAMSSREKNNILASSERNNLLVDGCSVTGNWRLKCLRLLFW